MDKEEIRKRYKHCTKQLLNEAMTIGIEKPKSKAAVSAKKTIQRIGLEISRLHIQWINLAGFSEKIIETL